MCDVPSIAVFCSESIKCFPGTASKFFLKFLVTIPVAPIITGIIVHFRFHIRCISIHTLLYRVEQEECARLRKGVPYVRVYRYNPKHLNPKLNGLGDNGQ